LRKQDILAQSISVVAQSSAIVAPIVSNRAINQQSGVCNRQQSLHCQSAESICNRSLNRYAIDQQSLRNRSAIGCIIDQQPGAHRSIVVQSFPETSLAIGFLVAFRSLRNRSSSQSLHQEAGSSIISNQQAASASSFHFIPMAVAFAIVAPIIARSFARLVIAAQSLSVAAQSASNEQQTTSLFPFHSMSPIALQRESIPIEPLKLSLSQFSFSFLPVWRSRRSAAIRIQHTQ
jgi:hypothetical protein